MSVVSLFDHASAPGSAVTYTDGPYAFGTCFYVTTIGQITSVWFNVPDGVTATGQAAIYPGTAIGVTAVSPLVQKSFTLRTTAGWQEIVFDTPLDIVAGSPTTTFYTAVVVTTGPKYTAIADYFDAEVTSGELVGMSNLSISNGRYTAGSTLINPIAESTTAANYGIDVSFDAGASGGPLTLSASVSNTSPQTGTAVNLTTTSSVTPDSYAWTTLVGSGTFSSASSSAPQYTCTAPGKHLLKCIVTSSSSTAAAYVTLIASDPTIATTGHFTATAADTIPATGTKSATLSVSRGGVPSLQTRSLYGHRLSFGDAVTNPRPYMAVRNETDHSYYTGQGCTYGVTLTVERDCLLTKIRFLKAPTTTGPSGVAAWARGTATPIYSQAIPDFVSDQGGWVEVVLDRPVQLLASASVPYMIGYYSTNGLAVEAIWTYGSQEIVEYPFHIQANGGGVGLTGGSGYGYGALYTPPIQPNGGSFFIDPVVEWESDDAVYSGGDEYYKRWSAYEDMSYFPIGAWRPLPGSYANFAAVGVNTSVSTGDSLMDSKAGLLATNMDVYVAVDNANQIVTFQQDAALYSLIKGYFIRDEPDLIGPWTPPPTLLALYTSIRRVDPSKLIILNLGFEPVLNKGFTALPSTGATPSIWNQYWRQFTTATDIVSCDFYMEDPNNAGDTFGLWCNPRIVQRMQDISNHSKPVWSYVMTSGYAGQQPTPQTVYNSVWAHLIGGARGIVFFDYIFNSGNFVTDNGMASNSAMTTKVTALCARIQSLKDALLGPEAAITASVASSNISTAGVDNAVGGEFGVPIHYTVRQDSGHTYIFAQSIRPGTTTGTFTVPAATNKTITVIDESRTISVNGSGVFSDSFSSDYAVHLYQWS